MPAVQGRHAGDQTGFTNEVVLRTLLFTIAYEGTDYVGWQRQPAAAGVSLGCAGRNSPKPITDNREAAMPRFWNRCTTLAARAAIAVAIHRLQEGRAVVVELPAQALPPQFLEPRRPEPPVGQRHARDALAHRRRGRRERSGRLAPSP